MPTGFDPESKTTVTVYVYVFDSQNVAQQGVEVKVSLNVKSAWYVADTIENQIETYTTDSSGLATLTLIETDTLTSYTFPDTGDDRTVYYNININDKQHKRVYVPSTTDSEVYLSDLPVVTDDSLTYDGDL